FGQPSSSARGKIERCDSQLLIRKPDRTGRKRLSRRFRSTTCRWQSKVNTDLFLLGRPGWENTISKGNLQLLTRTSSSHGTLSISTTALSKNNRKNIGTVVRKNS